TACTINGEKIIMSIIRDISERKNLEARLVYLANYDFITDIPNRSYVIGNFKQLSEDALANKKHLAVISFDIDKFKLVNDTYGHQSGDAVLKEISQRIASVVTGLLGRVGGDEFLILQPFAASREAVADLVERIFGEFERPIELSTGRITITTSIGISVFPDDSQDMDSLLNFADNAMYKAKISSGNTCVFFSDIQA
ncbi:MAG: GGDEF domain-containing protein, partial [Clostridia bacterium]|nr:GGDEF domain-containing protein [Clostridia bacterium]